MKNDCNVVRDLMPLVIDKVASEESSNLVTAHVQQCESCAGTYKTLQGQIAGGSAAAESAAFARAADSLKRLKKKRRAILIAVTALVTAIVLFIGNGIWNFLHTYGVTVRADSYSIKLLQIKGTNLVMELYEDMEHICGWSSSTERTDDATRIIITARAPLVSKTYQWNFVSDQNTFILNDGKLYTRSNDTDPIDEIVQVGRDNTEKVVYKQGDSIPISSDEMAAYYMARIDFRNWRSSMEARYTDDTEERSEELKALYDLVPEFK